MLALVASKFSIVAYVISATSASSLVVSKFSIDASFASNRPLIVTSSAIRFLISASFASNRPLIVTFSETSVSILAISASSLSTLTLSATIISNSEILLPISSTFPSISFTVSDLADGEEILPVTRAVWFFIMTVTLSPSIASAVAEIGVRSSDPSSFTYFPPSYSTIVPYTVVSLFCLSSLVI